MRASIEPVLPASFAALGAGLHRPESVVATPRGDVIASDWRGGVSIVRAHGAIESRLARDAAIVLRPNGVALAPDGAFLLANLGDDGGVWRLDRDGALTPVLTEIDGVRLPATNFAVADERGRIWVSVSTRSVPRQLAWRAGIADGFVACVDENGARIVADGLHYTNEVRPDPTGTRLYVVETFGRRVIRFPIEDDNSLGTPTTIVQFGHGFLPDGVAFDADGGVWVTSLVSNRVVRVAADGSIETVVEEANPEFIDAVEQAYGAGTMEASHLGVIPGTRLQHVTSIAFGGEDGRTAFLGSLHGDCVYRFRVDVTGIPAPYSQTLSF
jgi:sugar lactone lactonase YvrE